MNAPRFKFGPAGAETGFQSVLAEVPLFWFWLACEPEFSGSLSPGDRINNASRSAGLADADAHGHGGSGVIFSYRIAEAGNCGVFR